MHLDPLDGKLMCFSCDPFMGALTCSGWYPPVHGLWDLRIGRECVVLRCEIEAVLKSN